MPLFFRALMLATCLAMLPAAHAADYPEVSTLQLLAPELTLPENVEALKRAGVSRAEIDLVLARVLYWWDDGSSDLTWLAPEKTPHVRAGEAELQQVRRTVWRDRLVGTISERDGNEKRRAARQAMQVRLAEVLTSEELASYNLRSAPDTAKVREWTHGLNVPDDSVLWLAEAEAERRRLQSRLFTAEGRGVTFASDAEAADLVRVRTAMLALPPPIAATYLSRADSLFYDWAARHAEAFGFSSEIALRLYALRRGTRFAALELHENRSIAVPEERLANARLYAEAREKVSALLGGEQFERYQQHELGRWLAGEVRVN